ncbi:M48 family metallopeptidase [Chroococcidiopsis sp. CCNUC1]|uniref:tetratricopeptide repeat protein n=1 Tax=Chroococcidiopsis sp. CCNUC1 TaxID=2653189 RepID=UPI00201FB4F2|nr:tetratricopeptide repeat protein [Chroococcidiopsis sp. CCNUC1]URD52693.1 tetratricopeptide repeat protein [Chroococcidiopsis sp. CCNUC1]
MGNLELSFTHGFYMPKRRIERIAAVISIVSFGGSMIFGAVQAVSSGLNQAAVIPQPTAAAKPSPVSLPKSKIPAQEREYEIVLKSEPNNQIALEGLVNVRLQMQDHQAAMQPLEKLVKLNPSKQEYKTLLAQVKQEISKGK